MTINPNIAVSGRGVNVNPLVRTVLQNRQLDQQQQQFEQRQELGERQLDVAQQNADIRGQQLEQQGELNQLRMAREKFALMDAQKQSELRSMALGASQILPALEQGDTQQALELLNQRREGLIGTGRNTTETDQAIAALQSGNPEQINRILEGARRDVRAAEMFGIIETPKMSDFDRFMQASPEERNLYKEFKSAGAARNTVNVSTNTAEDSFQKEFGKTGAEKLFEEQTAAQDALASLESSKVAKKLLDDGLITGFGANFKVGMGKALQASGFDVAEDAIANTEAYVGQRAQEVGRIIKLFGAGTGLSDADRQFATKAAAGEITMTEPSIRRLLKIQEEASRNVIKRFNDKANRVLDKNPNLNVFLQPIEVPSKDDEPGNSENNAGGIKFLGFEE